MFISELWAACRRRWYLAVLFAGVSIALLAAASTRLEPTYESTASVVLIPPQNVDEPNLNRFLDLASVSDTVEVLARSMSSAQTANDLTEEAPNAEYQVMADPTTSAPILYFTASSASASSADAMLNAALDRVPENLASLQDDIDIRTEFQITARVVSLDEEPAATYKSMARTLAVIAAALGVGSALLLVMIDGLLLRRARRKAAPPSVSDQPAHAPEDPPPATETTGDELRAKARPNGVAMDPNSGIRSNGISLTKPTNPKGQKGRPTKPSSTRGVVSRRPSRGGKR